MELLLLKLVVFSRPLASMEYLEPVFVAVGGGLFLVLVAALLIRGAVQQELRFTAADGFIVAFTIWVIVTSAIHYKGVRVGEVMKLLVPLLSYTIAKNVLSDRLQYSRMIVWLLLGFTVPTILSAWLIAGGNAGAIDMVNYWTDIVRWEGVYTHSHNLGHSMTFLIMALIAYVTLCTGHGVAAAGILRRAENVGLVALAGVSIYCLYMSQVRSAILGLVTFLAVYTFQYKKRLFVLGAGGIVVLAMMTLPFWFASVFPEFDMRQRGLEVDTLDLGSGRPRFWLNDLTVYAALPIDEQLGGVGVGATRTEGDERELYGHNDWLDLLTQTGLVGFLLYAALQITLLRGILKLSGRERHIFLALFLAVNVMMAVSNSYVWRIQVSQLYFIILAFIEIPVSRPVAVSSAKSARERIVSVSQARPWTSGVMEHKTWKP